jgi:hypothetical protein
MMVVGLGPDGKLCGIAEAPWGARVCLYMPRVRMQPARQDR